MTVTELIWNWIAAPEKKPWTSQDEILDRAFGVHDEQYLAVSPASDTQESLPLKLRVTPGGLR